MKIRFAMLAAACLLSGCAAQSASTNSTAGDEVSLLPWGLANVKVGSSRKNNAIRYYVRTDGQPIDSAQAQAVLAQCQSLAARSAYPWEYTNACMTHNGYVAQ